MATTTYGTEYVQSSDLVSNWPGSSLNVANRIDNVSLVGNGVNNQTGTSYTLVLADGGKLVTFSNAAAIALTVPTNASVAFPTGVRIKLTNKGAGLVTVAGAGGVTLNGNQLTIAQNRSAMLYKLDTNTWVMTADPSIPSDPGLAFITASTFTGSTGVNVNNCFTSTYDWYRILLRFTSSASADVLLRLRLSGTDAATDYVRQLAQFDASTVSTARSTAQTAHIVATGSTTGHHQSSVDVFAPAIATPTTFSQQHGRDVAGTAISHFVNMGGHNVSTAYDGFSLIPASGNITGTVRVYGYRNS